VRNELKTRKMIGATGATGATLRGEARGRFFPRERLRGGLRASYFILPWRSMEAGSDGKKKRGKARAREMSGEIADQV
jgi:hypothetical protein